MKKLTEHQLRVLSRIASLFANEDTTAVSFYIQKGGIREYSEERKFGGGDLPPVDPELVRQIPGG